MKAKPIACSWKALGGAALSLVFIFLAFRRVSLGQVLLALGQARYGYLLPVLAVIVLSLLLRSLRWQTLLAPQQKVKTGILFASLSVGYMANTFLPAHLGEFVRAFVLSKKRDLSMSTTFATWEARPVQSVPGSLNSPWPRPRPPPGVRLPSGKAPSGRFLNCRSGLRPMPWRNCSPPPPGRSPRLVPALLAYRINPPLTSPAANKINPILTIILIMPLSPLAFFINTDRNRRGLLARLFKQVHYRLHQKASDRLHHPLPAQRKVQPQQQDRNVSCERMQLPPDHAFLHPDPQAGQDGF